MTTIVCDQQLAESREDLDSSRLTYFGMSWGAILPAIERRIKVDALYVAGMQFQRAVPEADQINYVTRVTQPTLMLNGELDLCFSSETSQRPLFGLPGTPSEHKKRRPAHAGTRSEDGPDPRIPGLARTVPWNRSHGVH